MESMTPGSTPLRRALNRCCLLPITLMDAANGAPAGVCRSENQLAIVGFLSALLL
jgi:hypothetical protein